MPSLPTEVAALSLSLLCALLFGTIAGAAETPPAHPIQGAWRLDTAPDALRQTLDASVEAVASEFNILVREVARGRIRGATKVCQRYSLAVEDTVVRVACDDGPVHALPRDGSVYRTTNAAGEPVQGTVRVSDAGVVLSWRGGAGGRTNRFSRSGDVLTLKVTVNSEHMPRPLEWSVDYRQSPTTP